MRALFLYNPRARNANNYLEHALMAFKELNVELVRPEHENVSKFSASIEENATQVDLVIVAGGDGSLGAAVPGLIKTQLPLAVLPLGTSNNFARNLGIPLDFSAACKTAIEGGVTFADVCYVNEIPFLNVIGIGLSTRVNKNVRHGVKRTFGPLGYAMTAFRFAINFRPFQARIVDVEKQAAVSVRTFQLTLCNGKYFGSGLSIADNASIRDSQIDLCSFEVADVWEGIRLLLRFRYRRLRLADPIRRMRSTHFRIETPKPRRVDVDGEIRAKTPLDVRVSPNAIRVMVPRSQAP